MHWYGVPYDEAGIDPEHQSCRTTAFTVQGRPRHPAREDQAVLMRERRGLSMTVVLEADGIVVDIDSNRERLFRT